MGGTKQLLFSFNICIYSLHLSQHVSWFHPSPTPPPNKTQLNLREKEGEERKKGKFHHGSCNLTQ